VRLAGSSLLALIDDIATLLDDVALLTKVAAKKTAGVLGDDLALNAEQVSGVRAQRELPVVWAVAKGSLVNKAILVPVALAISILAPRLVSPLLMVGGAFLCFEGTEKLAHKWLHGTDVEHDEKEQRRAARLQGDADADVLELERQQVKGAVRTDFVLSAEIIAITLGEVAKQRFLTQLIVLTGIALIMTVGVYGVVAAIVKLDDAGLYLSQRTGQNAGGRLARGLGRLVLRAAPYLMKTLSVGGTIAMFLVGGGIIVHGVAPLHHAIEATAHAAGTVQGIGPVLHALVPALLQTAMGVLTGIVVLLGVTFVQRLRARRKKA
jgi:predicted DNA repair protein MutK